MKVNVNRSPIPGYDIWVSTFDVGPLRDGRADATLRIMAVRLRWWHRALALPLVVACIRKGLSKR